MHARATALVSEEEFLSLEESKDKIELIDGDVYVSPAPTRQHQRLTMRLSSALHVWASTHAESYEVLAAPVDVRFGPSRILQPDIAVFSQIVDPTETGPITQIPILCIEVLSTNRTHDRVTKRHLYAHAGVQEYWTIDPEGMIERWTGDVFQVREEVGGQLTSKILPGFELDTDALFA